MPVVTITEAAKLAGKSRPTMYRYIEKGVVSTCDAPGGERGIDTSELLRVFGVLHPLHSDETPEVSPRKISEENDVNHVTLLREQLERERARADKAEAKVDQLHGELIQTKNEMIELYNRLLPAAAAVQAERKSRISRAVAALLGKD